MLLQFSPISPRIMGLTHLGIWNIIIILMYLFRTMNSYILILSNQASSATFSHYFVKDNRKECMNEFQHSIISLYSRT